jgi:ornithine cyclodeaminase
MRVISARDLRELVPMTDAIAAVRQAFVELSAGRATVPLRTHVPVSGSDGALLAMPASLPAIGGLGAKLVTVFPRNPARRLPTIFATVVLLDAETGEPEALVEGTYLTALRTGAAGGLAADLLGRPDAGIVALFGAGAQARTQLEALCAVRAVTQVRVVDSQRDAADRFVSWAGAQPWLGGATIVVAADPALAVRGADLIVTATTSPTPVVPDAEVAPGAHVTAVGAYTPHTRELPGSLVARAAVVVDSRTAALAEAGDLVMPIAEGLFRPDAIRAEIGEVAAGTVVGRQGRDEITVFKSVGHAVQDLAVGRLAFTRAAAANAGIAVELREYP